MSHKLHIQIVNLFVLLLAAATVADQLTRTHTLNPNIFNISWVICSLVLIFINQRFFNNKPQFGVYLRELKRPLAPALLAMGASIIFGFLAVSKRTTSTYLVANIVCALIVIISISFFVSKLCRQISTPNRLFRVNNEKPSVNWLCALIAAGFASITYRPNTDDHYYVNLSTYIFEHGIIPTRDTVLSNQLFSGYPRISTWELLVGSISHWLHISPANLLYIIFVPIGTMLSIFALSRLFSVTAIKHPSIALVCATAFLITDGANGFTFGNFQGPRIWQGKSLFLAILIPLVFAYIIELLQTSSRFSSWHLSLLVTASIGATSTSLIILPVFLMAGILIASLNKQWSIVPILICLSAYIAFVAFWFRELRSTRSVSFGAAGHILGASKNLASGISHSASTVMPSTYELLTAIAKPGWHAMFLSFCVVFGIWTIRSRIGALYIAGTTAAWAIISLPQIHEFIFTLLKAQAIGWRYMWLVPVPYLVGATASQLNNYRIRSRISLGSVFLAVIIILPATFGYFPWQHVPGTLAPARIAKPFTQKVGFGFPLAWKAINMVAEPGDRILARNGISASLAATTTLYYPVSPRDTYVRAALGYVPNNNANDRIELTNYIMPATETLIPMDEIAIKLQRVEVNVVCLPTELTEKIEIFQKLGYTSKEFIQNSISNPDIGFWCGRTDKYNN